MKKLPIDEQTKKSGQPDLADVTNSIYAEPEGTKGDLWNTSLAGF